MAADLAANKPSFFACYLLCSLNPRFKGRTYIGFTVNPKRRIRQHNGEITSGARKTQKRRPWEMILCVHGFPSHVHALQFEWAWQHPLKSIAVRDAAKDLKRRGARGQVLLLFTMLNLPEWNSMNLVVNFLSTKHQPLTNGCPSLPLHMLSKVGPLDDLPCYSFPHSELYGSADEYEFEDVEEADGNSTEDSDLPNEAHAMDGAMQHQVHQGGDRNANLEQENLHSLSTKHQPLTKGCPSLPLHMLSKVGPLDDLPCYSFPHSELYGSEDEYKFEDAEEPDGNITEDSDLLHEAHAIDGAMQCQVHQGGDRNANVEQENLHILSAKDQPLTKGCPSLPLHMLIKVGPLDDLPCYSFPHSELYGSADEYKFEDVEEADGNSTENSDLLHDGPKIHRRVHQENANSEQENVLATIDLTGSPISCSVTRVKRQLLEVIDLTDSPAPGASSIKKFTIV